MYQISDNLRKSSRPKLQVQAICNSSKNDVGEILLQDSSFKDMGAIRNSCFRSYKLACSQAVHEQPGEPLVIDLFKKNNILY